MHPLHLIIDALLTIGTPATIQKAASIEASSGTTLNLRSLDLSSAMVNQIAAGLSSSIVPLSSISFSYNSALGDAGAKALAAHLPKSLTELGMVDCGLQDEGGLALLEWAKTAPKLRMICIEQNAFSEEARRAFVDFSEAIPHMVVCY